ncbi:helix-turn-helix domain-containing protein [Terrimicrobium sacchariphilum]|uniref:Helix-turn-helix domain-containing protein n=1 Tax=Terrimicrobium sacchariphilum TaxID=690879 RepID=A0A146G671_TERSA|nr:helix-turn-helix domain-containing protein [Terrimicrobium sacchariphilum]
MSATTQSQADAILAYLRAKGRITPMEALRKFGSFRLGARIYDLKRRGFMIHTKLIERRGKRFAQYEMSNDQPDHAK